MPFQFPADIQNSIAQYVAQGSYPSEEEVVRAALRLLDQQEADLASIRRGLEDIANGNFRNATESNEEFRRTHQIPVVE